MKNIMLTISVFLLISCSTQSSSYINPIAKLAAITLHEDASGYSCLAENTFAMVSPANQALINCVESQGLASLKPRQSSVIEALLANEQTISF